ncbi:hypothetical protein BDN72DRAFT_84658 [Pluteus cervinus]|uniref:Uncharacterized protein n=1 Tax=Pluteus cervinus TaxID=181527 RepID=A0ACD2ZYC7_9AGAR|nr:hypothetical protein BDN72DRAFT_84658 [Pluteus cervinus]
MPASRILGRLLGRKTRNQESSPTNIPAPASTSPTVPIPSPTIFIAMQNSGILPDALYRPIIEYISEEKALYQLTLASQILRLEAQRVLYHTLVKDDLDTHKGFLKSITRDPRLASYVREYSLMATKTIDKELWGLLALGLQSMTHLSSLGFRDHGGGPSASKILPNCTFQLDSLNWECNSDEDFLIKFLATQPRIRKLSLAPSWGLDTFREVPPTYLPDLEQCCGGHGVLRSFLPNHRITRVRWIPDLEEPLRPDPIVLSHINQSVKMLSFGGYFGRMELPLIATHLQSLEFLELIGLHVSVRVCFEGVLDQYSYAGPDLYRRQTCS